MEYEKQENLEFQKLKIKQLNNYFMRGIYIELFIIILFFTSTIVMLFFSTKLNISLEFKITMLSLLVTYITSTSKDMINKFINLIEYKTEVLIEEQRGLSKRIGIEVEKVIRDNQENK